MCGTRVLSEASCRMAPPSVHLSSITSRAWTVLCTSREARVRTRTELISGVRSASDAEVLFSISLEPTRVASPRGRNLHHCRERGGQAGKEAGSPSKERGDPAFARIRTAIGSLKFVQQEKRDRQRHPVQPPATKVDVEVQQTESDARIVVRDAGPGIPAEQRAHIGRRFYRAPGTQASGSGLGLSIAQRIVDGGHRVLILYEGGDYDTNRFSLLRGGWDHEHCTRCSCRIEPMTLCWVTEDGPYIVLCEECHVTVVGSNPNTPS